MNNNVSKDLTEYLKTYNQDLANEKKQRLILEVCIILI